MARAKLIEKVLGTSISVVIVVVNLILKTTIIRMVYAIGEETQSKQKSTITYAVFLAQFVNTGFVILLVNANLSEHLPPYLAKYFKGLFYDYSALWYVDVGTKIQ